MRIQNFVEGGDLSQSYNFLKLEVFTLDKKNKTEKMNSQQLSGLRRDETPFAPSIGSAPVYQLIFAVVQY